MNKLTKADIEHYYRVYDKGTDASHGSAHVSNVVQNAIQLAKKLKHKDLNTIYAAALLHDIGNIKDREKHHLIGYNMVLKDKLLHKRFDKDRIQLIANAVKRHRASDTVNKPITDIDKIINDADRMDSGLHRAVTYERNKYPDMPIEENLLRSAEHMSMKYGKDGYALKSLTYPESKKIIADKVKPAIDAYNKKDIQALAKLVNIQLKTK